MKANIYYNKEMLAKSQEITANKNNDGSYNMRYVGDHTKTLADRMRIRIIKTMWDAIYGENVTPPIRTSCKETQRVSIWGRTFMLEPKEAAVLETIKENEPYWASIHIRIY